MAKTTTISSIYVQTYESTVRHLAQQSTTRLAPWVMEKSVQSEGHNWERQGLATAEKKSGGGSLGGVITDADGRLIDTPVNDSPFSRRKSIPDTWHTGDTTEQEDIVQMIIDPNSNIAQSQGKALRRAKDDAIIDAAVGLSRDGGGGSIAFPAAQGIGASGTVLSFDMVTEVTEKFLDNDIDSDEEKVFVIGPKQQRKLLQLTEATNQDYAHKALLKGYVDNWMGYTWIVSTRLQSPTGDDSDKYCFAMTKKAIGLQTNKDIWSRIAEDPTKSFAWRIYCAASFGAIRVEDEQVVRVLVKNALS